MIRSITAVVIASAALGAMPRPAAQQPPDMFSCIVPSRLATGTFLYQNDTDANRPPIRRTISAIDAGGQRLVRLTWVTSTPSEQITDLQAGTLIPVRTQMSMGSASGERRSSQLEVVDGEVRGRLTPASDPVAISTGGRGAVFGPYVLEVLAAAVDWQRCPAVTTSVVASRQLEAAVLRRNCTATYTLQGTAAHAIVIDIERQGATRNVWITETAPHFALKFTGSMGGGALSLVSRER